jgi:hypothetical protein
MNALLTDLIARQGRGERGPAVPLAEDVVRGSTSPTRACGPTPAYSSATAGSSGRRACKSRSAPPAATALPMPDLLSPDVNGNLESSIAKASFHRFRETSWELPHSGIAEGRKRPFGDSLPLRAFSSCRAGSAGKIEKLPPCGRSDRPRNGLRGHWPSLPPWRKDHSLPLTRLPLEAPWPPVSPRCQTPP